jgi:hypothetical protein
VQKRDVEFPTAFNEPTPNGERGRKRKHLSASMHERAQDMIFMSHWQHSRELMPCPATAPIPASTRLQAVRDRILAKRRVVEGIAQ